MTEKQNIPVFEAITESIDSLFSKMEPDNIDEWYDDADAVIKVFTQGKKIRELLESFELIRRQLKKNEQTEKRTKQITKIARLITRLKTNEPDFLLEALKRKGSAIANSNIELKKSINGQMFRILEQIRLGKKDNVVHIILRTFAAKHKQIPPEIIDALREEYDINQFRAFMYAFLNNFITEKSE